MNSKLPRLLTILVLFALSLAVSSAAQPRYDYEGRFFAGRGDADYLELLNTARRMFEPDPEYQNMAMFYLPAWNGLVEGPTWNAWWIQNSYGPTYCALPFWREPFVTFVQNSQDLWFDQMGDGHHVGAPPWNDVAPVGALCDCARPGFIIYKQGDGRTDLHDWGVEFTAAGLVLQCEALLIARDPAAIARYLPKLERCADFLESRRDPRNNLYLAGAAGNLLAPSHAGWKKPDGSYAPSYLAGLSITTIAALDRLIELEKLAGRPERAQVLATRRELSRRGLPLLTTREGYFLKSLDPDGTPHGVYGAARHGYFEAVVNHDAICFRVSDDAQSQAIYSQIAALPGLRPYDLIITNYPSLDDLYTEPTGLWEFGRWVNGGHWSTCEARMIMAYYRLGHTDDARRSMRRILGFARQFRMDNNLTHFGRDPYQPKEPINCVYDAWGIPAAFIRGLFEYLYQADRLVILPHVPAGITRLEQRFPIRFGAKQLFLTTTGTGAITGVRVNGQPWTQHDARQLFLPYDQVPARAQIELLLGGATLAAAEPAAGPTAASSPASLPGGPADLPALRARLAKISRLQARLAAAGLGDGYEAAHARLAIECFAACEARRAAVAAGTATRLTDLALAAADHAYVLTVERLCEGLEAVLNSYAHAADPAKQRVAALWTAAQAE
ncbi:MAG: hypothetical protein WCL24_11775 [Verrucomicrobiota bacterium]